MCSRWDLKELRPGIRAIPAKKAPPIRNIFLLGGGTLILNSTDALRDSELQCSFANIKGGPPRYTPTEEKNPLEQNPLDWFSELRKS